MRDVQLAAKDCGIGTGINSAADWAPLVTLINMPDRKQDVVLKKMKFINSFARHGDLCIPTMQMCNDVSYDKEAKNFWSEGIRKTKEAIRQSTRLPRGTRRQKCLSTPGTRGSQDP